MTIERRQLTVAAALASAHDQEWQKWVAPGGVLHESIPEDGYEPCAFSGAISGFLDREREAAGLPVTTDGIVPGVVWYSGWASPVISGYANDGHVRWKVKPPETPGTVAWKITIHRSGLEIGGLAGNVEVLRATGRQTDDGEQERVSIKGTRLADERDWAALGRTLAGLGLGPPRVPGEDREQSDRRTGAYWRYVVSTTGNGIEAPGVSSIGSHDAGARVLLAILDALEPGVARAGAVLLNALEDARAAAVDAPPESGTGRGAAVDLARAAMGNREMLQSINDAVSPRDQHPVVPRPLGRPAAPGEPTPVTPDRRDATLSGASEGQAREKPSKRVDGGHAL